MGTESTVARAVGIDIGTSSTKVVVVDEFGNVVDSHSVGYPLSSPRPGWSEQDPEDWVRAAAACLSGVDLSGVASIGISGQMHGLTPLDSSGAVVRPAILWNDQRTAAECEEWESMVGASELRAIVANAPMTGFQLPKLLWMRNHEPREFDRIRTCLLPKDYVAYRLTARMATDPSDAAGTGAMDVRSGQWSESALDALGLDASLFPPIVETGCEWTGRGIPIYLAGGDQSANGVGTGCIRPELRSLSLGSSAVVFSPALAPAMHVSETLNCFNHIAGGWLQMGVSLNGTLALEAFANRWLPGTPVREIGGMARAAGSSSESIWTYPYFGGERCPINDPHLSPRFVGDFENAPPIELARSILRGIAFNLAAACAYLDEMSGPAEDFAASGGGAQSDDWLQIFADVLGRPVHRLATNEGPAYGAALVAGIREGVWESFEATARFSRLPVATFVPEADLGFEFRQWKSLLPNDRHATAAD